MEWYGPLTILPAIGMIILATGNYLIALNDEIYQLEKDNKNRKVIILKLKQLKRLGTANVLLYSSALFLLLASLSKVILNQEIAFKVMMVFSTIIITISLIILCIHSIKAISIRNENLKIQ
jgi:hypothetical protein